jgi:hypothetical protein
MTFNLFIILLAVFSAFTSLLSQAVKLFLESTNIKYASNIIVLCASIFVGGLGTVCAYIFMGIPWSAVNIVCIFLMILANWLVAMLGYDKVMQAITQLKGRCDMK